MDGTPEKRNDMPSTNEEAGNLAIDLMSMRRGALLYDPDSCTDAQEVSELLRERGFLFSIAHVEGFHDPVLDVRRGESFIGKTAIRDFIDTLDT